MTAQDLKNSILQLAVQGKLMPQDPSDEPIDLKGLRLKKTDECEFEIPDSWRLAHLESISIGIPSKQYQILESEVKQSGKYSVISQSKAYSIGFTDNIEKVYSHKQPVVVFGDHTTEVKYIDFDFVVGADGVKVFEPIYRAITAKFLFYALQYYSIGLSKVGGYSRHYKFIKNKPIPLPPLAEQERIVAKIEELMPLVEEYGKTEEQIKTLNAEFPDKLRKSILQQAVQGKLTERDPADEPASELLKRICAEKAKLIAEGKIKKEKPLPPITDEEKPFEIPDTWAWERIGNLFSVIRGSSPRPKGSPLYWSSKETEFHWVTIKDISDHTQNGVMYKTHEHLTELGSTLSTYVEKGELIVAVSGSTTGKFCVLGINGFIYDGLAAVLNPMKIISSEYLKVFYSWVYQILNSKKIGSAFPNINTDVLKNTLIPIPPLEEQQRIVARVEELLAVCDGLK